MAFSNDTLVVTFAVANQQFQKAEECTIGLIITAPHINFLQCSGTNTEVSRFHQDSLAIVQDINSVTRLKDIRVNCFQLQATGTSYFDLLKKNTARHLVVHLQNKAAIHFNDIRFEKLSPVLKDSAAIVLSGTALGELWHAVPNSDDLQSKDK
jgi:hypothetical protein